MIALFAFTLPVLLLMTAFAVDLGRQRAARREMQARADIIALDMVRLINLEDSAADIQSSGDYLTYLRGSADRNHARHLLDRGDLIVTYGTFTEASGFIPSVGNAVPDAVEVIANDEIDYFFQPGTGEASRSAVAMLGGEKKAGFSIGSFGATLTDDQAGFLNTALTPLLGHPVGLDVLSYKGLATTEVGLGELGTELGLLTPDAVLNEEVEVADAILAAADILRRNGAIAKADLLDGLITPEIEAMDPVRLGSIVHAEQGGEQAALSAGVNVLALIQTAALLSECDPELDVELPLVSLDTDVRVIQGPVSHYGEVGTGTETSQLEVGLHATLGANEVGRCTPAGLLDLRCVLNGLGNLLGFLVDATAEIDATIRLADGRATIADIDCVAPEGLDVRTNTGLYTVDMTVSLQFQKKTLLGALLGSALGSVVLRFTTDARDASDLAEFDFPPDILGVTVEPTGSGDIGLNGVGLQTVSGEGVLGTVGTLLGLGLGALLEDLVNPLLRELDDIALGPLTDLLGINVVGSDITPERIDCVEATPKLVH